jgi:hypothetical protein
VGHADLGRCQRVEATDPFAPRSRANRYEFSRARSRRAFPPQRLARSSAQRSGSTASRGLPARLSAIPSPSACGRVGAELPFEECDRLVEQIDPRCALSIIAVVRSAIASRSGAPNARGRQRVSASSSRARSRSPREVTSRVQRVRLLHPQLAAEQGLEGLLERALGEPQPTERVEVPVAIGCRDNQFCSSVLSLDQAGGEHRAVELAQRGLDLARRQQRVAGRTERSVVDRTVVEQRTAGQRAVREARNDRRCTGS